MLVQTILALFLAATPVLSLTQVAKGRPLFASVHPEKKALLGRRAALQVASLALAAQAFAPSPSLAASGIGAQAERGAAAYGSLEKIEEYASSVKACRRLVANPEFEVKSKRKEVERTISRAVDPLIDAMLLNELSFELTDEQLATAAALPQEMKVRSKQSLYFSQHYSSHIYVCL